MKFDFTFYNPTKIYFGRDSLNSLKTELRKYGKTVLLVYGGGSIKKLGLYDKVIAILKEENKRIVECSGVMPNPTLDKMLEGAHLAKENQVDLILAVGGGSVIDCAKGMSVAAYAGDDVFRRFWLECEPIQHRLIPVGAILTMAGTGSEMNGGSVITDTERKIKTGRVFPPEVYPKFSILNPEYTYTVSEYQMVSGIFDIMSHLMEQYFSGDDDNVSDYLIEALLKNLISSTKKALRCPKDYEARSNIMWIATLALNTVTGCGKEQDWEVHNIEHQLGAYTDCAHGMGLSAISVPYYRHIYTYGLDKFVRFAENVWNISSEGKEKNTVALEGIDALANFIKESKMASTLKELGATEEMLPLIADSCYEGGGYKRVNHEEILEILKECFE